MYKHFFFSPAIMLACAGLLQAQPQQRLNIESATVFLNGAELTSTAKINLSKGENEISFTNVAGDVNQQSLIVSATNGVAVASATFQNNYLAAEVYAPRVKEIKDSLELMAADTQMVHNKISTLNLQIGVVRKNEQVSGQNTGLNVAELAKLEDFIAARMEGYMNQRTKEEDKMKKLKDRMTKLDKQLDEEQRKGYQPGGQLLVKFFAKEATAASIVVDYIVPHAGWAPTYDVMADDASGPIKLFYKANIYQNSGVKWNNVRLTLSTGNPNEGAQAPNLAPWYLAFYIPQVYAPKNAGAGADLEVRAYKKALVDMDRPSSQLLTKEEVSTMNEYVSVDNSGINTSFDIDLPYTIPSDGQQHLVAIKKYELPATYRYYAVPKLDKDAFLQAQVTNWEDLNLLPGTTNIFYEGTYVGQGMIDVRNVKDTMILSLGRDKKIVVKRERDTKLRSVKMVGMNVRETFAYSITVRNTRKEPVTLTVEDQMPVSNDKDIVIEDKDSGNAEYDETTGMMKWNVTVNQNEAKKIGYGYTVKYPKGKTIANMPR